MAQAESDCSLSLKLDNTYVKAYQRRAAAREALGKLDEAQSDLLQVLLIEPNNKESKMALETVKKKLESVEKPRPLSKFTASRNTVTSNLQRQFSTVPENKTVSHWPSGEDDIMLVKTINKPVHLRSKKPLKRIHIVETEGFEHEPSDIKSLGKNNEAFPQVNSNLHSLKTDDLKIIEKKEPIAEFPLKTNEIASQEEFVAPRTSVQFSTQWNQLKSLQEKYFYLKRINPIELPRIFKESFESDVFSQILEVLSNQFVNNQENVYEYLRNFTEIKRFSTITMFMDQQDKNRLRKLFDYVKDFQGKSNQDVESLVKKYEL